MNDDIKPSAGGCLILIVLLFIINIAAVVFVVKPMVVRHDTKAQTFTEVGSVQKTKTESHKNGITIDYWFDLPSGIKFLDNSREAGVREGDNVIVNWSIRQDSSIVVDGFKLKIN